MVFAKQLSTLSYIWKLGPPWHFKKIVRAWRPNPIKYLPTRVKRLLSNLDYIGKYCPTLLFKKSKVSYETITTRAKPTQIKSRKC